MGFVADVVESVWDGITSIFDGGSSYTPGPSENERHATKIANELAEEKERIRERSQKWEEDLVEELNKNNKILINYLSQINNETHGGANLNINVGEIERTSQKIRQEVIGSISSHIDSRLVQTDSELSEILEERNDTKRSKNFKKFQKKIQGEAITKLKNNLVKSMDKQSESLHNNIQSRINEVEFSIKNSNEELQEIQRQNLENKNKAPKQIEYMYKYTLCNLIMEVLK